MISVTSPRWLLLEVSMSLLVQFLCIEGDRRLTAWTRRTEAASLVQLILGVESDFTVDFDFVNAVFLLFLLLLGKECKVSIRIQSDTSLWLIMVSLE